MAAQSPAAMPQTVPEKIAVAVDHKERGNAFFKEGKFGKAKVQYCTALAYTKGLPGRKDSVGDPLTQHFMNSRPVAPLSEDDSSTLLELDATLKTNISVCCIKMEKSEEALKFATEALQLKPTSWKAMLRKGEAQFMLKHYDAALKTLDEALHNNPDPGNRISIMAVRNKVVEMLKKEEQTQKKAFKNIFERAQKEGEV